MRKRTCTRRPQPRLPGAPIRRTSFLSSLATSLLPRNKPVPIVFAQKALPMPGQSLAELVRAYLESRLAELLRPPGHALDANVRGILFLHLPPLPGKHLLRVEAAEEQAT